MGATETALVEAERADILVTVAGASLFSGAVALQKAREVAELVAALESVGIEAARVKVEDIVTETQSGTFSKSSSVSYELRVRDVPLEGIADAIGILTSAKNATVNELEWHFADETPLRDEMRQLCLQTALQRVQIIARTVGVRLIGIYELSERWHGPSKGDKARDKSSHAMIVMRSRVSEEEIGLSLCHSEEVSLHVQIQFRISEFEKFEN